MNLKECAFIQLTKCASSNEQASALGLSPELVAPFVSVAAAARDM